MELREDDLKPLVSELQVLADPFAAVIAHLDDAYTHVEDVYQMDQRGAFSHKDDQQARALVTRQLARAASLLRDLTHTAWIDSGKAPARSGAGANPISPANPAYNGETGTAPPPGPAVVNKQ
jgi:hypothetical protein